MELPFDTDSIEIRIMEVTGVVRDRRTEEQEEVSFYRLSGNTVINTLITELDNYGYDFVMNQIAKPHDVKIPVKDLIQAEPEPEDDGDTDGDDVPIGNSEGDESNNKDDIIEENR